jgi:integral membrane protein (TIGR01906 family)
MKALKSILKFLIIILVPCLLLMTSIRLLITPFYPRIEYRMPGFPADDFGFSESERLQYAEASINYLLNAEPISFLGDLKFKDGSPLYISRELSHMLDVKILVQGMFKARVLTFAFLVIFGIIAWRNHWLGEYFRSISTGGWATLGLVGLLIMSVFLDFSALFTGFHRIFFTGDTWLFYTSDSLIRLFPERFWSDAFIYIGIFTIIGGLAAIFGGRAVEKRVSTGKNQPSPVDS